MFLLSGGLRVAAIKYPESLVTNRSVVGIFRSIYYGRASSRIFRVGVLRRILWHFFLCGNIPPPPPVRGWALRPPGEKF